MADAIGEIQRIYEIPRRILLRIRASLFERIGSRAQSIRVETASLNGYRVHALIGECRPLIRIIQPKTGWPVRVEFYHSDGQTSTEYPYSLIPPRPGYASDADARQAALISSLISLAETIGPRGPIDSEEKLEALCTALIELPDAVASIASAVSV